MAGVPLRTIQHWMGHKSRQTTALYLHYAPREQDAELVERAFGGSNSGSNLRSAGINSNQVNAPELPASN